MTGHPIFLGVDHVVEIHHRLIEDFGGDAAIRDHGLLESATRLPQATFDGEMLHSSLASMAAAYLFHLCMNHPFVDGNKRTALAAAEIFLDLNGSRLDATDEDVFALTMAVAAGDSSKADVVTFFDRHTVAM